METPVRRRRDAAQTRRLLLEVARARFARHGYATTTVRDIADAAGVNVALINRYFASKEGLFEACLDSAVAELRREEPVGVEGLGAAIAHRLAGSTTKDQLPEAMLLLLRSAGDARIDEIRRNVLRAMSERLAAAAGSGSPEGDDTLLRAEIVLAALLGITMVRASLGVQPLASATEEDLIGPLSDLVRALLPSRTA